MKHTVTELHDPSEPVLFSDSIMENYMFEHGFGNFKSKNSVFSDNKQQSKILNVTTILHDSSFKEIVNNVDSHNYVNIIESKVVANSSTWTLYFDGSKSKEGAGVAFLLIEPKGNKTCIACRIEFNCTNNIVEYEALIQGLKKNDLFGY